MANEPSDTVLDEVPSRAIKFLAGVGGSPEIFAALARRGYTDETHKRGWALLHQATDYELGRATAATPSAIHDAAVALDAWDEPNFRWISSTLEQNAPAVHALVFAELTAKTGAESVVAVKTLLDRCDALEAGAHDGPVSHKDAKAALALLAQRGFGPHERKELRAQVDLAQSAPELPDHDGESAARATRRREARVALYRWLTDWSEMARAALKDKRRHQITVGIAKPQKRKGRVGNSGNGGHAGGGSSAGTGGSAGAGAGA